MELSGKQVVLGITGGIAAYKIPNLVRLLTAEGARVLVVMTKSAMQFVGPITFEALTDHPVHADMFGPQRASAIDHISLADWADLIVVAPATANILAQASMGLADDLLPTLLLAAKGPILFAPAMNVRMWRNPATQRNVEDLANRGCHFVGPDAGVLACGHVGAGRMAEPEDIYHATCRLLLPKPLKGKKLVISAGPTREPIDEVRYVSNRSSGKMGYSLARAAQLLGADTTLVSGPTAIPKPIDVKSVNVQTADEMAAAMGDESKNADCVIMAAAVADFKPKKALKGKPTKETFPSSLEMTSTKDIVKALAKSKKPGTLIVGFAAQSGDAIKGAKKKLASKNLDVIIANDVSNKEIGFDSNQNEVTVLFADGRSAALPKCDKRELAFLILAQLFGFSWPQA